MNIYDAIMKAADHIERYPREFNFDSCSVPKGPGCGTPGCAVGWMIFFFGSKELTFGRFARAHMGIEHEGHFYKRMNAFDFDDGPDWMKDARRCARNLRLYAAKYHSHEKPQPVAPDWVDACGLQRIPTEVCYEFLTEMGDV